MWLKPILIAGAFFFSQAVSEPMQECLSPEDSLIQAFYSKPDSTRLGGLLTFARQGSSKAQIVLGHAWMKGWGVDTNRATGLAWLKTAATQGSPRAQIDLAGYYKNASYGMRDSALYRHWMEKAVAQGYPPALVEWARWIAGPFKNGDLRTAAKLYLQAADSGYSLGMPALATAYQFGQGLPTDSVRAHMWFSIAEAFHQEKAGSQRKTLERFLSQEQVRLSRKGVKAWMRSHRKWVAPEFGACR